MDNWFNGVVVFFTVLGHAVRALFAQGEGQHYVPMHCPALDDIQNILEAEFQSPSFDDCQLY